MGSLKVDYDPVLDAEFAQHTPGLAINVLYLASIFSSEALPFDGLIYQAGLANERCYGRGGADEAVQSPGVFRPSLKMC